MMLLVALVALSLMVTVGLVQDVRASTSDSVLVIRHVPNVNVQNCHNTDAGCYTYTPSSARVELGGTVMFMNNDDKTHIVLTCKPQDGNAVGSGLEPLRWCHTSSGFFASGNIAPGGTFTWTTDKLGAINFVDGIYGNMEGSFTVVAKGASTNKDTETPPSNSTKSKDTKSNKWKDRLQEFKEDLRIAFDTDNKSKAHLIQLAQEYKAQTLSCQDTVNELNQTKTALSTLQSRFDALQTTSTEQQHTIKKLQQELADAKKKIEELETKELDTELDVHGQQQALDEPEPVSVPVVPTQTMSITVPESMKFDNNDRTIDLYTGINDRLRIDTYYTDMGTAYHIDDKAEITIFRDTWITSKSFVSTGNPYCYVGDLVVGQDTEISQDHTNTLNVQFRKAGDARCDGSPDITLDDKLTLTKEIYVRFVGTDGQVPFYHTSDSTIDVPKCTDANFNTATTTLIGDTDVCYGKSGDDTILVSKILAVFGV